MCATFKKTEDVQGQNKAQVFQVIGSTVLLNQLSTVQKFQGFFLFTSRVTISRFQGSLLNQTFSMNINFSVVQKT